MRNPIKKWFNKLARLFQGNMGKIKKEREQLDQAVSKMDEEGGGTRNNHRNHDTKARRAS